MFRWSGLLAKEIWRANRNLLLANLALVVAVLGIWWLARDYLYDCVKGGTPITVEEIAKLRSVQDAPGRLLRIHIPLHAVDSTYYTAWGNGQQRDNGSYYFLNVDGGRVLVIKTSGGIGEFVDGYIVDQTKFIGRMKLPPNVGLCRVMFDGSFHHGEMIALLVGGVPVLCPGLWNVGRALRRMILPRTDPVAKVIARSESLERQASALNTQLPLAMFCGGQVAMTPSFVFRRRAFGFDVVVIEQIVWAHGKGSFRAVIYDAAGRRFDWPLRPDEGEAWLKELGGRVPWAFLEFTPELLAMWAQRRGEFVEKVAERRRAVEQPVATGSGRG